MCFGRKRTLANGILIRVLNRGVRIPRVGCHCRNMAEPSPHSASDCQRLTGIRKLKPQVVVATMILPGENGSALRGRNHAEGVDAIQKESVA